VGPRLATTRVSKVKIRLVSGRCEVTIALLDTRVKRKGPRHLRPFPPLFLHHPPTTPSPALSILFVYLFSFIIIALFIHHLSQLISLSIDRYVHKLRNALHAPNTTIFLSLNPWRFRALCPINHSIILCNPV
jgi:hypothetical protein